MIAFMIIKGKNICWHFLKALPSANTYHCILREITVYFSDEVFSLKIWGHFIQQCIQRTNLYNCCCIIKITWRNTLKFERMTQWQNIYRTGLRVYLRSKKYNGKTWCWDSKNLSFFYFIACWNKLMWIYSSSATH